MSKPIHWYSEWNTLRFSRVSRLQNPLMSFRTWDVPSLLKWLLHPPESRSKTIPCFPVSSTFWFKAALPPPGSTLTLILSRRSGLLSLFIWFIIPVERAGKVSQGHDLVKPSSQPSTNFELTSSCLVPVKLWVGEVVPFHHVRTEELPPRALPQLEARSDGGTLYVRNPAENLWDIHRARGLTVCCA